MIVEREETARADAAMPTRGYRSQDDHSALVRDSVVKASGGDGACPGPAGRTPAQQSPVFVMNPYYTGLGIARCLRGLGMEVVALASESDAPGAGSRFFQRTLDVPNGRSDPQALCARLLDIGRTLPHKPVLLPTRDFDVLFLHNYRESLLPYYILPQGAASPIMRMMDKLELSRVAQALTISTPRTFAADCPDEVRANAAAMRFPVIMKPRFAYQWRMDGIWTRVGAQKAIIVESPEMLLEQYGGIAEAVREILVQEYIAGEDCDVVVCCAYIDERGEMLGHFTARKLRQDPPLVGTGCAVEAIEIAAIVEPTRRLLRAFNYAGMAEVEYKYDRTTDTYALIEINPRHWDQHELGQLVGVNLSLVAYRHLTGLAQTPQLPAYPPGARRIWIAERELIIGLLRHVKRELRNPRLSLSGKLRALASAAREFSFLLSGHTVFSVAKFGDPLLGLRWSAAIVRDVLRFAWSGLRGPHSRP